MVRHFRWQLSLSVVTVAVMAAVVIAGYFFMFFDVPYLSYKNLPFPSVLKEVLPGKVAPLIVHRCSTASTTKTYTTTHTLQNVNTRTVWILADVRVAIDPGCILSNSLVNTIPNEIPPGTYRLFGTALVEGMFRTHTVDWYSEPFIVGAVQKEKP